MHEVQLKPSTRAAAAKLHHPVDAATLFGNTPPEITRESLASAAKSHALHSDNFNSFLARCEEGEVLQAVLDLTTHRNFLKDTLAASVRDVNFRNKLVEILHGSDLVRSLEYIPWLGMIIDTFTTVPNITNQANLAEAQDSIFDFRELASQAGSFKDFSTAATQSTKPVDVQGQDILSTGLRITILANGKEISPQTISSESSLIEIDGKRYYNGIPGDRSKFPSLALPEGSKLGLKITNTTQDVLMVVPSVNGIPFRASRIAFSLNGFKQSKFPLINIEPHRLYIKPGETIEISDFACGRIDLSKAESLEEATRSYTSNISEYSELKLLRPLIDKAFRRTLSPEQRQILEDKNLTPEEKQFLESVVMQSKETYAKEILRMLTQGHNSSWRCEVVIKKPIIADNRSSDSLSNPMLGTIGCAVVKVTPPKRQDYLALIGHNADLRSASLFGGATRGIGGAGLATIGGGASYAGAKLQTDWTHSDGIHTFQGYIALNLISHTN